MSMQWVLEKVIKSINEEEAKEALTDILMVLSNNSDTEQQRLAMIEEIYKYRFYDKYIK